MILKKREPQGMAILARANQRHHEKVMSEIEKKRQKLQMLRKSKAVSRSVSPSTMARLTNRARET